MAAILELISGSTPAVASPNAKRSPSLLMNTGSPKVRLRNGPRATPWRNEGKFGRNPPTMPFA